MHEYMRMFFIICALFIAFPVSAKSDMQKIIETWKDRVLHHEVNRWSVYESELQNRRGYDNWRIAWNAYRKSQYAIIEAYRQTLETAYAHTFHMPIISENPIGMTDIETHTEYYEEQLATELLRLEEAWRIWSELTNKND